MDARLTTNPANTHSVNYYWNMVKDMGDSQKMELVTLLMQSMKPAIGVMPQRRYTIEEMNALLDQAEANIAAGNTIPDEDVWRELEEEFAREDAGLDALYAKAYSENQQRQTL